MRFFSYLLTLVTIIACYFFIPRLPLWQWFRGAASEVASLQLENASLRAQLIEAERHASLYDQNTDEVRAVPIYSTYPFSDRHMFTIAAGSATGIREGAAVLAKNNILLGRVTKAFVDHSEVTSIFSPDWQLSVKIGPKEINGLLAGGPDPKVTLVASDKKIAVGDHVYATSREVPYGYMIGTIRLIRQTPGSFFHEAELTLPYEFNDLDRVLVHVPIP